MGWKMILSSGIAVTVEDTTTFAQISIVNGVKYRSFRETCKACGLLADDGAGRVLADVFMSSYVPLKHVFPQLCPTANQAVRETLGMIIRTSSSRTFATVSKSVENYFDTKQMP